MALIGYRTLSPVLLMFEIVAHSLPASWVTVVSLDVSGSKLSRPRMAWTTAVVSDVLTVTSFQSNGFCYYA